MRTALSNRISPNQTMTYLQNLWYLFDKGGVMMIALVGASVLSIAIIIERSLYFYRHRLKEKDLVDTLIAKVTSPASAAQAAESLRLVSAPLARLLEWLLLNYKSQSGEELEKNLELQAQKILPKLEERLPLLNTLGSIAPLLGLLGTVLGMIQAFSVMARGDVASASLAGGISEALLTTAGGLFVAIPCVLAYNIFSRRVDLILSQMEVESARLIAHLKKNA
ncbi:MAG: MotA/TolQ/ExbB proton channel family protein [Spirochaetia bacterium]|nr:MotA/TolQ/ExbB proton channel family protein [Spirochaetia bacterium]